jgi:acyl carrier protein
MSATATISEEDFIARAREFLGTRLGSAADDLTADTELIRSGLLDSLLVLEFFFFLEQVRGSAVPEREVSNDSLATLRRAYRLVSA